MEDYSIPVQYVDPVSFNDLNLEISHREDVSDRFLNITIKNIIFLHHYSFSLEVMLCAKLIETFEEYSLSLKELEDLSRDIRVIRETKQNLKQEFLKISPNKKEDIRLDQTLRKYANQLIQLKDQYRDTLKKQRQTLHKMISVWSDIQMVREKYNIKQTPYVLEIMNKQKDQQQFEEEWADTFKLEFSDMLDKIEFEYISKYIEYKELKTEQSNKHSEIRKTNKPKLHIDEDALKKEVEEIVNNMVTSEKIDVLLKKDERILTIESNLDALKHIYQFEVYVDKVFVCRSEGFTFQKGSMFNVEFTESFSVQILPKNETMTVTLIEDNETASAINVTLSDIRQNSANAEFYVQKFTYNNLLLQPNQNNVGRGHTIKEIAKANKVRLKSSNIFEGNLQTECEVNLKMGWNENLNHNQSEMIKNSMEIGRQLKRLMHGIDKPSIDTLQDMIGKIYGTNAGNNEEVIETLQNICKTKIKSGFEFPLNGDNPEFVRIKLLHLRNIGGFSNIEHKLVPLYASQISTEQLNCLQKSVEKDIDVEYISDKYAQSDPIELQRFIGCKYVQKLNEKILRNLHDHLMKKTHKDVVRDFQELSIRFV